MKVLIVDDEIAIQQIIAFMLESQFQATPVLASSGNQAIEILRTEKDIDLVISDYNMPDGSGSDVSKYLLESGSSIPFVLCSTYHPETLTHFKLHPPNAYVQKPDLFPALDEVIANLDLHHEKSASEVEYCHIRSDLVLRMGLLHFDLYIRLNPNKYVKAFRKDDVFENVDFERFEEKKINYFYLKSEDASRVLETIMKNMSRLTDAGELTQAQAIELSTSSLEFISNFNRVFGLSPEVQELTHATVKLVVKTIQSNVKLSKLYSQFFVDQDNYLVSHSLVLSYFACGLASLMGWTSDITFYILTLSAFFHDLSLETDNLSRIQSIEDLEAASPPFSKEEVLRFLNHPEQNAKLIDELSDSPAYVANIILQHHERPDGSGFPNKLTHDKIHPLTAIFIIAEEMVSLNADQKTADLEKFIRDRKTFYSKDPFRKVIDAMSKSLSSP